MEMLERNSPYYVRLSPDGRRIVYTLWGESAAGGEPTDDLWVVATRPGSTPRAYGHGTLPKWSSDGRSISYFRKDAGDRQLWVLDVVSGRTRQVTRIRGGITVDPYTRQGGWIHDPLQYAWSPDGTRLVFVSEVAKPGAPPIDTDPSARIAQPGRTGTPLVLTNSTPVEWTMRGVYRGHDRWLPESTTPRPPQVSQLFIVDVRTLRLRQLTRDGGNYFNPDWSPDGRRIVCVSTSGRSMSGAEFEGTQVYAIDVATGSKTALTSGAGVRRLPTWSPDGRWIAFFASDQRFGKEHALVMAAEGGAATDLTRQLEPPRSPGEDLFHLTWAPDSRSVIGNYNGISGIDVTSGDTRVWVPAESVRIGLMTESIARYGSLAWEESNETSHGVIRILRKGEQTPEIVADLNPQMKDWMLGAQELVHWKNARGEDLEGVLIMPAGYVPGRKYPLIVDCYPGYGKNPHSFFGSGMMGNQGLASRGYAVFFPAFRAPHVWMNVVRNEAFMNEAKGPDGWATTVDDIMSGVDELIRRGVVDPDRMGLTGFSNGGGIVDYLVTATPRFRCAVSAAPVYPDWLSAFFLPSPGAESSTVLEFSGGKITPWDDPQAWLKLSAVLRLPEVRTPMLLAVGDDDLGFLPGILEMYNGLRYLGKEVTLLRYEGQGHGFGGTAMQDFWDRKLAFYGRYLKPEDGASRSGSVGE